MSLVSSRCRHYTLFPGTVRICPSHRGCRMRPESVIPSSPTRRRCTVNGSTGCARTFSRSSVGEACVHRGLTSGYCGWKTIGPDRARLDSGHRLVFCSNQPRDDLADFNCDLPMVPQPRSPPQPCSGTPQVSVAKVELRRPGTERAVLTFNLTAALKRSARHFLASMYAGPQA